VLAERRLAESEDRAAEQGIMKGIRFTAKLLQRVASPELEARLLVLVLEDLPQLPPAQVEALQEACRDPQRAVKIATAFPLAEAQRSQVVRALRVATHENVTVVFEQDSSLMAGLRISVGPWAILANLCDELQFFAEMVKHDVRQE
jgi:F-type H+-transporting ATPase subunit b